MKQTYVRSYEYYCFNYCVNLILLSIFVINNILKRQTIYKIKILIAAISMIAKIFISRKYVVSNMLLYTYYIENGACVISSVRAKKSVPSIIRIVKSTLSDNDKKCSIQSFFTSIFNFSICKR